MCINKKFAELRKYIFQKGLMGIYYDKNKGQISIVNKIKYYSQFNENYFSKNENIEKLFNITNRA
jgi:hypothetical protein